MIWRITLFIRLLYNTHWWVVGTNNNIINVLLLHENNCIMTPTSAIAI